MNEADVKHRQRGSVLVVSTAPVNPQITALLDQISKAQGTVRWGYIGRHRQNQSDCSHRLRTFIPKPDLRYLLVAAAGVFVRARHETLLAAKFDPWFHEAARASDLVVATDLNAVAALSIARELSPGVRTVEPGDACDLLNQHLVTVRLLAALQVDVSAHGKPIAPDPDDIERACKALREFTDTDLATTTNRCVLHEYLEVLVRAGKFTAARDVISVVETLGDLSDDPIVDGYRAFSELSTTAHTDSDVTTVATGVLEAADTALSRKDLSLAAVLAALAMDLLFHRELHSDTHQSDLVDKPEQYLAPLQTSAVGRLLTSGSTLDTATAKLRDRTRLRVTVTPGPYGSFYQPVAQLLQETPYTDVTILDLRSQKRGFNNLKTDTSLVQMRLEYALGRKIRQHSREREELQKSDVIFADWADKAALLASMSKTSQTRLIVRIHSVDLLRPWLHLIDWTRVDELICVSTAMRELVRDLLGSRLESTLVHVVPNVVDVKRFSQVRHDTTDSPPRTLCMIGWAQRVKDPVWALNVLACLVEQDPQWRLVLIGADFAHNPTASGQEYARAFRERAMADDLRDHITYVGFTDDLPHFLRHAHFVLSSSRRESFHLGLVEGALAGAIPVVRDWPLMASRGGAAAVYPTEWIVESVDEAVDRIKMNADPQQWEQASVEGRQQMAALVDTDGSAQAYRQIVLGESAHLADLIGEGSVESDAAARHVIDEILSRPTVSAHLLRVVAWAAHILGEMTFRVLAQERLLEIRPSEALRQARRRQIGRIRETSPDWMPTVDNAGAPIDPVPGRILHVLKTSRPYRNSGYAVRGWYTLREQRRLGIDAIGVTALDVPESPDDLLGDRVEDVDGVPHHRLVRDQIPDGESVDAHLDAWATALATTVSQTRPSALHVHSGRRGYETALVALSVGNALKLPVVYEVRGFLESLWRRDLLRTEHGETYQRRYDTEVRCMQAADAIVTLSESMRAEIVSRGIDADKVFVVPNAVDPAVFEQRQHSVQTEELVSRYRLEGRFVFGYVSNLDHPREGHELLIQAAIALRARGVPATALIVGDGRRRQELEDLALDLDAGDAVIFTGQVPHEHVQDYYSMYDVFVVPRVDERAARLVTPLKPYEAMAIGVPMLVSDLPALLEVIGHGQRGSSFAAGNIESLASALQWSYQNPEVLTEKSIEARRWVVSERTWHANALVYRQIYEQLGAM